MDVDPVEHETNHSQSSAVFFLRQLCRLLIELPVNHNLAEAMTLIGLFKVTGPRKADPTDWDDWKLSVPACPHGSGPEHAVFVVAQPARAGAGAQRQLRVSVEPGSEDRGETIPGLTDAVTEQLIDALSEAARRRPGGESLAPSHVEVLGLLEALWPRDAAAVGWLVQASEGACRPTLEPEPARSVASAGLHVPELKQP